MRPKHAISLLLSVLMLFSNIRILRAASPADSIVLRILKDLETMQMKNDNADGFKGMYPTLRRCFGFPQRTTRDNSIFFTGTINFTLRGILPFLSHKQQMLVEQLLHNSENAYPHYKNKKGLPYYYFRQNNGEVMLHSIIFSKKIASNAASSEDIDDTSILLLSMNAPDSTAELAKAIFESFANTRRGRTVNSFYKKYKHIPTYSTWLGPKMRVDFDLSVFCNVLYFVNKYQLPYSAVDSATVYILADLLRRKTYLNDAAYCSPYYYYPEIILYHISRLMGTFYIAELEPYRKQIINDIYTRLAETNNVMYKLILQTSLLRLGEKPIPTEDISALYYAVTHLKKPFFFFQARAGSQYPNMVKRSMMRISYINYGFTSPTYNEVLLLEYIVLNKEMKIQQQMSCR
ncbi:hypothetical protein A9P82_00640 [Arachidicoccus ginsenosidimutans]|uniref:hypothetical protein n=1 Tax=Arachidicoccus sp. BS20 TaxID=1850526 RepID=UPI0007F08B3B|nr:hypothetical protein [Arachidicoccus sp. BS20]ANI87953.1 hypothetical protein A9P82_00640 [Arachidicoccus sp. BS20]